MSRHPPRSTPFPYTTLFRSRELRRRRYDLEALAAMAARLEDQTDSSTAASTLLTAVRDAFGFERAQPRSEEHTSELQSRQYLVCRLLLEKKTALYTHS